MVLPTTQEQEQILVDRPGDDLYPEVKDDIKRVSKEAEQIKKNLVSLMLSDMTRDLAISDALNYVGKVLNYLPQDKNMDIEVPEFSGGALMNDFSRITKLKMSMDYAVLLGMDEASREAVLKAEIGRLWGDPNSALLKRMLADKAKKEARTHPASPPIYKKSSRNTDV